MNHKLHSVVPRNTFLAFLVFLALLAVLKGSAGPFPTVRSYPELNLETKIWVEQIQQVMTSGQPLKVTAKEPGGVEKLKAILGPYVPVEKVGMVEILPKGEMMMTFTKEHVIDLPTQDPKSDNKYIRVTVSPGKLKGQLVQTVTAKNKTPIKLLAFFEPQIITIDPLNAKRESTVPGVAKMMGMLPKIVALAYHEDADKGPLVAPQLNGMGASENARLMKDLLFLDDTLFPELTSKK